MFVDHTVIAAMMSDEEQARTFARRLQKASSRMTSPIEAARAAIAVCETLGIAMPEADAAVKTFLQLVNIQCLACHRARHRLPARPMPVAVKGTRPCPVWTTA